MAPQGKGLIDIAKLPKNQWVYQGSDNGKNAFEDKLAWSTSDYGDLVEAAPSTRIALGLTECCAKYGEGKVSFWPKDHSTLNIPVKYHTQNCLDLPDLICTPFNWTKEETDDWFNTSHELRALQLNARSVMSSKIACMPIALNYDSTKSSDVTIIPGWSLAVMAYNAAEDMFLGFADEMTPSTAHFKKGPDEARDYHRASKDSLAQFKVENGLGAAVRLHEMFRARRRESLMIFGDLTKKSIEAHKEWASLGGYDVETDPSLSRDVIDEFKKLSADSDESDDDGGHETDNESKSKE